MNQQDKNGSVQTKTYCCTSRQGLCYWAAAFGILYGIGLALAIVFGAQRYELAILFTALGLACAVNFARNRTFHCVITGPFFLLVALALALETSGFLKIGARFLWPVVLIVVGTAFFLERQFAS